jgi:1-acyl-sn-glycerol-3-phosphate acyltransferase
VLAADDPVGQVIAGAARVSAVRPDQTLGDLGLDSLGLVELALALEEKTSKTVHDGDLRLDMTVQEVRAFVASAPALEEWQRPAQNGPEGTRVDQPLWPYTWGRVFRNLSFPFDVLYRFAVTRTVVLGREHLERLPRRVIFAGTHHGFTDVPLVRHGLAASPARRLAGRLVVAAGAGGVGWRSLWGKFGVLAFGLYPLRQYGERDASLRHLARVAAAGNAVLIFPQGTHAKPEQERASDPSVQFRSGVAHLASALDAAVVPFGLAGTERLIPPFVEDFKGPLIAGIPVSLTRGPLAIAFGAPMTPEPGESPQEFAARLQDVSYGLTRQAEQALSEEKI